MAKIAKIFKDGSSEAVQRPVGFSFDAKEVFIRRDPVTGDVILSRRPNDWTALLKAIKSANESPDVLCTSERAQGTVERDPFDGWNKTD
ncbi:MAG: AbrB/MazE/SpoVT family DNA-binding domain-containing protein [Pseudomonadota bacterium]